MLTARDMQRKVEQRLLSLEIDSRKFKSEDIFDWLNYAQDRYIRNRFDPIQYNNADNFHRIQRELDDLRLVMLNSDPLSGSNLDPVTSAFDYTIPALYRHTVRIRVQVIKPNCPPVYKGTRIVSNLNIDDMMEDILYRTSTKSPLATLIQNKFQVYFDSKFTLGSAIITYIKVPARIGVAFTSGNVVNTNCELAEHTHDDIVELAVEYAYRILSANQNQNQE